jgi:hypothetical protein
MAGGYSVSFRLEVRFRTLKEREVSMGISLGVFGSRSLKGKKVKELILEQIEIIKPAFVVVPIGRAMEYFHEPAGVTFEAKAMAIEMGIPLKVFPLEFKYKAGAFDHRSKKIIAESDLFLIIHDGQSHGTKNELELVKKTGKPFIYKQLPAEEKYYDLGIKELII